MGGGGGAEEELTAQETALYDRQIRVWGVDAQKRYPRLRLSLSLSLSLFP
jgi:molybdopterin/thiamine biosynthesis adenylyltransferase